MTPHRTSFRFPALMLTLGIGNILIFALKVLFPQGYAIPASVHFIAGIACLTTSAILASRQSRP
jgi:hypothetical protein